MLTRSLIRTSVMRYISLLIARLPALFHGRKPIVIALTSTVIKGQTSGLRGIVIILQVPVGTRASVGLQLASILARFSAAHGTAFAFRGELILIAATSGVDEGLALVRVAVEIPFLDRGTASALCLVYLADLML